MKNKDSCEDYFYLINKMDNQCKQIRKTISDNKKNIINKNDKSICENILLYISRIESMVIVVKKLFKENNPMSNISIHLKVSRALELIDLIDIEEKKLSYNIFIN